MSANSFPKENRLLNQAEFSEVYKKGCRQDSQFFVFYLLSKPEDEPRLGIVTPKSLGKAVERNRIKRAIREGFRKNKAKFAGYDFIVKPKKAAVEVKGAILEASLPKSFPKT